VVGEVVRDAELDGVVDIVEVDVAELGSDVEDDVVVDGLGAVGLVVDAVVGALVGVVPIVR
jgi:hypothetical protein